MASLHRLTWRRLLLQRLTLLLIVLAGLFTGLVSPGLRAAESGVPPVTEYTLGVLAFRGKALAERAWQPTVDYLNQSLPGIHFRLLPLLLDEMEDAVGQRRVDFVLTNPENYIVLEARHQVSRNATLLTSHKGLALKQFGGLIFARAERNDLRTFADLQDQKVAAVARNSFGAYQMQAYELLQAGIDPGDIRFTFTGLPQDKVVEAVQRGEVDAGFIRTGTLEAMAAAGKIRLEDFRGIGLKPAHNFPLLLSTALYPEWAFATLPHLDEQLANRVTVALLKLPFAGEVARAGGYHGWAVPLSYNSVHDMMKALRAPPYDAPQTVTIADIARKYDREIIFLLIGILALLGFFMRRFARLNHSLQQQMALAAERSDSLAREMQKRERFERQVANENRVLELLTQETPLPRILQIIAGMFRLELENAAVAVFLREGEQFRLAAVDQLDPAVQQHWRSLEIPARLADDRAGLTAALALSPRRPLVEIIRDTSDTPAGLLVAVPATAEASGTLPPRPVLEVFTNLIWLVIERSTISERMRLASSVFENALEGIVITDPAGCIIDISPSFTRLTGYDRAEAIGRSMNMLKSGRQGPEFYQAMWQSLLTDAQWSGEIWDRTRDGREVAEMLQISAVKDKQGRVTHFIGTFNDITSLKEAQAHLEKLASYDLLTGLPNRGLLADRIRQALSHARRRDHLLAVCFLDLDGFKAVNDTFGHEAGDILLCEVARRLNTTVRAGDTVARLGGDEFVLLLGDIRDIGELEVIIERVLTTIAAPYTLSGQSARISTSIGVTIYPFDDSEPEVLMRHADQAMYRAKQDGRNRHYLFDARHAATIT